MQYILSVLVMISVVFFGMELVVPVGAATSTVSGEAKLQISGTHMKRSILERKIRMMQSELKKTATAISLAEKKITYLVSKGKSVRVLQDRLNTLKIKQKTQEASVMKLETELIKFK